VDKLEGRDPSIVGSIPTGLPKRHVRRYGTFGARPCTAIRARLFRDGEASLPRGWRRGWIIARIKATPPWADFKRIRSIYQHAQCLSELTGVKHQVDHEIPLQHPMVCGLHVPENLRVVTEKHNYAKKNRWCPDQLELF
jgi:hypothetical protein